MQKMQHLLKNMFYYLLVYFEDFQGEGGEGLLGYCLNY